MNKNSIYIYIPNSWRNSSKLELLIFLWKILIFFYNFFFFSVKQCKHTKNTQAEHYKWSNKSIILGAHSSSNGIYNFILRLRAHMEEPERLRPIVLLLEKKPNMCFLDAISWFPLVYWAKGSIDNLDNLLVAGIHKSDSVVVVNNESTNSLFSIHLADCNTIIAVQSM